jgi:hypothetical protein
MDLPIPTPSSLRPFLSILKRDALGKPHPIQSAQQHLDAAVAWLERAHDKGQDGGVSYGYSARGGWRAPYRETSGYIAETFFDLAKGQGAQGTRADHRERAIRICGWLCRIQNNDGSISNPAFDANRGIVFDTGMVLHGLVRGWEETGDPALLAAAEKAGDWLTTVADGERRWTRFEHNDTPHVYNTRTAWALARLHQHRPTPAREAVFRANLDWAVSQERNGYYQQNAFVTGNAPFTHNIAYAIRGLLETGLLIGEDRYVRTAEASARVVTERLRPDGYLPGAITVEGRPAAGYCCMTGNAQMAGIWARLYVTRGGDGLFRRAAIDALRYVMSWQDITTSNSDVRGAIKGSQPAWGRYSPLTFPNWATKFFIDAMLMTKDWHR